MSGDIVVTTRGNASSIECVEARDAAKYSTTHGIAPLQQGIIWSEMSVMQRLRNPDISQVEFTFETLENQPCGISNTSLPHVTGTPPF